MRTQMVCLLDKSLSDGDSLFSFLWKMRTISRMTILTRSRLMTKTVGVPCRYVCDEQLIYVTEHYSSDDFDVHSARFEPDYD